MITNSRDQAVFTCDERPLTSHFLPIKHLAPWRWIRQFSNMYPKKNVFSPCVFQQAVAELLFILSGWSVGLIQHVADVFSQKLPWFERRGETFNGCFFLCRWTTYINSKPMKWEKHYTFFTMFRLNLEQFVCETQGGVLPLQQIVCLE